MFVAALLTTANEWKRPRRLSTEGGTDKRTVMQPCGEESLGLNAALMQAMTREA